MNGKPAVYTWTEQTVIGYENTSVVTEGSMTTFTNTLWERPEHEGGKKPKTPGTPVEYIDEYSLPGTKDMEAFEVIGEGDRAFPVAWCAGGGDWQMPVVFCIYIGADGVLHGYLPDNGNAYDRKENAQTSFPLKKQPSS